MTADIQKQLPGDQDRHNLLGIPGERLIWARTGETASLETLHHVAKLSDIEPGLVVQDALTLQKRLLTGDAVLLVIRDQNSGGEKFIGYQSLPRKYDESIRRALAMVFGIYGEELPLIDIREWSTAVTDKDFQNRGVNQKLKALLEQKKNDEKNGAPILTIGEAWDNIPASLHVNLIKNRLSAVDSVVVPFAAEFLSAIPFLPGQGKKDLKTGERRLMGDELMDLERRIKSGERMSNEEIEYRKKFPGLVLMASDMDLVSAVDKSLASAMDKLSDYRKTELIRYLEATFPDVYNSIRARYSDIPGIDKKSLLAMVGGLRSFAYGVQKDQ